MTDPLIDHGNVAHQLMSPLSGILNFARLLKESNKILDDEERLKYVDFIIKSGEKMEQTIKDLMELTKVSRSSPTDLSLTEIDKEIDRLIESATWAISQKSLSVQKNGVDMKIRTHPVMFSFILQNLITNAVKFTPNGGEIKISAEQEIVDEKKFIKFTVADSGIGMDEETKSKLFTNKTVSNRGTNNELGNGLGLLGCLPLINKLGGKIWVESELGKGSTFYFTLPVIEETETV
jgi:signal transduction histidine kinase